MGSGGLIQQNVIPRALVCTDHEALAASLCPLLAGHGFLTDWTALPHLGTEPPLQPWCDVALFDVDLPGLNQAFIQRLRFGHPYLYTAMVVGWWDIREEEFRSAADFVLHMPVRAEPVADLAADFLRRWSRRRRALPAASRVA